MRQQFTVLAPWDTDTNLKPVRGDHPRKHAQMLALHDPRPGEVRVCEQPRRHYVVERLAFEDGVHVSLCELRTDDQAHLPAVSEEMGGALCRVLKLGR